MTDIKNLTREELAGTLKVNGYPGYTAGQIFDWAYKKRVEDFDRMSNISREARKFLKENFCFSRLTAVKRQISCDGTEKFLFQLNDKSHIESALIPENDRLTLCVSTQVGCKFKCAFCSSGQAGFKRNLTAGEIVGQYLEVQEKIKPRLITNLVYMGIGEPLDNFSNTAASLRIFLDHRGIGLGKRRICVSTAGIIPAINELHKLNLGVKLAISLHSPDDAARSKIMPVNKKYPLYELMKAARDFSQKEKWPVSFEYAMFRGLNTGKDDAQKLARLTAGMDYKLNLMTYNSSCHGFLPPTDQESDAFINEIKQRHMMFTLRRSRGQDIDAACGQLRAKFGGKA